MITTFFGIEIKNGANFADGTDHAFVNLFERYEGVRIDVPETTISLFYYKDPKFGQHVLAYYVEDGNLFQVGVTKPYILNFSANTFEEIHALGIQAATVTPDGPKEEEKPKEELPTPDEPTKEVEEPKEPEAPKEETPKEEVPAEEKPADTPAEELPEAGRDEKVFFEAGKYFVERGDQRVFVKPVKNAYDVATGEMILEDAPEGAELFRNDAGTYYYVDKALDKIVFVKAPKKEEEAPKEETPAEPEAPKNEEPKEELPKDEVPADEPKEPEAPKEEEPKAPEGPVLNGVKITRADEDPGVIIEALEGKEFTLSEDGKVRIYELLKALSAGEISVDLFFHEIETGVLSKAFVNAGVNSVDLIGLRKKIEAVIAEVLNKPASENTPS